MPGIYAELKIELRSDLCIGSGMSNTGIIDQDIVYDDYGFPYIPAKRIKGCLREAAEDMFKTDIINCLFGDRTSGTGGSVEIGNAVLKRENALLNELRALKSTDLKEYVNPEAILDMYTSVRVQTKIDEGSGTAKDNNLRYTRVVNQFDPFEEDEHNLSFYAPVCIHGTAEYKPDTLEKYLEKAVRALRHIGINRNRGLGNVRCSCNIVNESAQNRPTCIISYTIENVEPGFGTVRCNCNIANESSQKGSVRIISYVIENVEPMILSDIDKNDSATFISGKSILGVLAGEYIKSSDKEDPAATDEFADLFLNGTVKFTNLTMVINGQRSYPAPLYLKRRKKTGDYVNVLMEEPTVKNNSGNGENAGEEGNEGNQPKKLKNKYIAETLNNHKLSYMIDEVDKEINFHYTKDTETEEEQLLFSLSAIKKGQRFAGEIVIDSEKGEEYVDILERLLKNARLSFGKSKSAQYGLCHLVELSESEQRRKKFNCGDRIVVTMKSDALFIGDKDSYTVHFDNVKELLAEELSDKDDMLFETANKNHKDQNEEISDSGKENEQTDPSIIDVTEVFGYNTKWNMKRSSAPAIMAGSAFVFELKKDWECNKWFVGERTQEGFGEISVHALSEMSQFPFIIKTEPVSEDLKKIISHTLHGKMVEALLLADKEEADKDDKKGLGASQIGRLTLMLKESLSDENGRYIPSDDAAKEFGYRLQSIKTYSVRREAIKYAEKTLTVSNSQSGDRMLNSVNAPKKKSDNKEYCIDTDKIRNILKDQNEKIIIDLDDTYSKEEKEKLLKETWGEYMLQSLTLMKYRIAGADHDKEILQNKIETS